MSAPTGSPAGPRETSAHRAGGFVPPDESAPLVDRAAAEAYVASVCFKHGPPRLIGTELEWLVRDTTDPTRPLDLDLLARALGPHAPRTLSACSPDPHDPLPLPCGSAVTVEPGGQVEIASPPLPSLSALVRTVRADATTIRGLLAAQGLTVVRRASDPARPPRRILDVPRYAAMEAAFDRIGPHGRTMMCSTSAVQVCVDAGEGAQVAQRWAALHELGPVLLAAFANSPVVHGRRTGWKSSRMASWLALDPDRTSPPRAVAGDPGRAYARRALDTQVLCVRGEETWEVPDGVTFGDWIDGAFATPPTRSDLDYHLTTLFPPVRPQGHLEVRYIDQQPDDEWAVALAVVAALMLDPGTVDRARAAAEPASDRWTAAARHGLADRVLRRAAGEVFEQAHRTLAGPAFADLDPWVRHGVDRVISDRVLRGRCPADERLDESGEPVLPADGHLGPDDPSDLPRDSCDPEPPPAPRPVCGGDPA